VDLTGAEPVHVVQGGNSRQSTVKSIANVAQAFVDVATAATALIGAAASKHVNLTGSVAITAFDVAPAGTERHCKAAADFLLTHNATALILPGGQDISVKAGETFTAVSLGSGNWLVFFFQHEDVRGWVYATPQATTSGSAWTFSIPAGVSEIELYGEAISLTGSDHLLAQIGDAGGFETSGYVSSSGFQVDGSGSATGGGVSSTSGFVVYVGNASANVSFRARLERCSSDGTKWTAVHTGRQSGGPSSTHGFGIKTLSAEMSQLQLTVTGVNTGDAGEVGLRYR